MLVLVPPNSLFAANGWRLCRLKNTLASFKTNFMIKFIPKIREVESQLAQAKEWVSNLTNRNLFTQLTERFGEYRCKNHPEFCNELLFDFYYEKIDIEINSVCCEHFKELLELIKENKDPFTGNDGFEF